MVQLKTVCVFCGSSPGNDDAITAATIELAELLVERDIGLVYGGGAVGLMGLIADTVMARGGSVTGIIPVNLFSAEVSNHNISKLIEVDSMHARKAMMYDFSDAFIALPGGFGTLEELAEVLTWLQIGLHSDPVGVLDVNGYWQPLLRWADGAVDNALLKPSNRSLLLSAEKPAELLDMLASTTPRVEPKWIS